MIVIAGVVNGAGIVLATQGMLAADGNAAADFASRRFAYGVYLVDFTPVFIARPTVVVTVENDGNEVCSATVAWRSNQQIVVRTIASGGVVDKDFHFVAIGRTA